MVYRVVDSVVPGFFFSGHCRVRDGPVVGLAVVGAEQGATGAAVTGRVDRHRGPLDRRGRVRHDQRGVRVASRADGQPAGPARLPLGHRHRAGRIVRRAVCARTVRPVRRPRAGRHCQGVVAVHDARVSGRDRPARGPRPLKRGGGVLRRARHASGLGGRAPVSVRRHERPVAGRGRFVPGGCGARARDAHGVDCPGPAGRSEAFAPLVPARRDLGRSGRAAGPASPERPRRHGRARHVPRAVHRRREPRGVGAGAGRDHRPTRRRHHVRRGLLDQHAARRWAGRARRRRRRVRRGQTDVHRGRSAAHRPVRPPAAADRLARRVRRRVCRVQLVAVHRRRVGRQLLDTVRVRDRLRGYVLDGRRRRARRAARRDVPGQRQVARRHRGQRDLVVWLVPEHRVVLAGSRRGRRLSLVRGVLRRQRHVGLLRLSVPVRDQPHVVVRHPADARPVRDDETLRQRHPRRRHCHHCRRRPKKDITPLNLVFPLVRCGCTTRGEVRQANVIDVLFSSCFSVPLSHDNVRSVQV